MNPPGQMNTPQLDPRASPLHPPSVVHNTRILSSLGTLSSCFAGLVAGITGLTNSYGFLLYLLTSILTAIVLGITKCNYGSDVDRYVPIAHSTLTATYGKEKKGNGKGKGKGRGNGWKAWWSLMGLGQETFLGFLLFWIGSYALIHVYD